MNELTHRPKVVYSKRGNDVAVLGIPQFVKLFTTENAFTAITKEEYQLRRGKIIYCESEITVTQTLRDAPIGMEWEVKRFEGDGIYSRFTIHHDPFKEWFEQNQKKPISQHEFLTNSIEESNQMSLDKVNADVFEGTDIAADHPVIEEINN